jgi:hypothetical protein
MITNEQALLISTILSMEIKASDCDAEVDCLAFLDKLHEEADISFKELLDIVKDKEAVLKRQGEHDRKIGYLKSKFRDERHEAAKALAEVGFSPGKLATYQHKKIRLNGIPHQLANGEWLIAYNYLEEDWRVNHEVNIKEIILDGLECAMVFGCGPVPEKLLKMDSCEVIEGNLNAPDNELRPLKLRKLPGGGYKWSVLQWHKAGWNLIKL